MYVYISEYTVYMYSTIHPYIILAPSCKQRALPELRSWFLNAILKENQGWLLREIADSMAGEKKKKKQERSPAYTF